MTDAVIPAALAPPNERTTVLVAIGLGILVLLLCLLSLMAGRASLSPAEVLGGLTGLGDEAAKLIVREVRLPRTLLGLIVGGTLGLTGAALQGLLRNPLAEPALLGVSGSASLGAVIAFYFGFAAVFPLALPLGGMAGALVAVLLLYALAGQEASPLTLILAGVAINSMAAALTALALNLAPSPYAAVEILFWLLGSLADRSFDQLRLILLPVLIGWLLLAGIGRSLDALSLGEDTARSLGINLAGLQRRIILGTAFSVGATTSVTGSVGFIGLVVPHLLRPLVGYRPGVLLWLSALGGAALTLAADIVIRLISSGQELRLGVITALLGAPFFLWLVLRTRRSLP